MYVFPCLSEGKRCDIEDHEGSEAKQKVCRQPWIDASSY